MVEQKVIVTGGGGFIGSHLLPRLRRQGWRPLCLARPGKGAQRLLKLGYEVAECQFDGPETLAPHLSGASCVFHLAGAIKAVDSRGYYRGNVDLAQALAGAIELNGGDVKTLVFVSSLSAGGPWSTAPGRNEFMPDEPVSHYGKAKLAAEKVFLKAGLPARVLVLRPPVVFGPGDLALRPFFNAIRRGIIPVLKGHDLPMSLIYAGCLADCLCRAAKSQARAGTYYVGGTLVPRWSDFGRMAARSLGVNARVTPVPARLFRALGGMNRLRGKFSGRIGMINPDKYVEAIQPGWLCDDALFRQTFKPPGAIGLKRGPAYDPDGLSSPRGSMGWAAGCLARI